MNVGKVIGGNVGGKLLIRLKSNAKVDVGDLLVCENENTGEKFFLKVVNMQISSLLAQQFIEEMAGQKLEHDEIDYNIFDAQDRFYRMCEAKILKIKRGDEFYPPRSLPNFFTDVRKINESDDFISQAGEIEIGYLRLGREALKAIKTKLPAKGLISHHMLVVAATGKGKSNFARVFLRGLLKLDDYAAIVFDPHNEYYGGKGSKGLRDHPLRNKVVYFSPKYESTPGAERLIISTRDLEPDDFFGIIDLSSTQQEALDLLKRKFKGEWIEKLLGEEIKDLFEMFDKKIARSTLAALRRKIYHALELHDKSGLVFTLEKTDDVSIYDKIKSAIEERKIIIIDTSMVGDDSEKIIASSIVNRVFNSFRYLKQTKPQEFARTPEVLIVFEEAPRVLGSEALANGVNIFERIAREGRKFKVGLCAITQMPSLLPAEILSQMNTKVILGLPSPADRSAVINSATQNISDESVEIQMLDRGEAIITSPFIKFPLPTKIFSFDDILKEDIANIKTTEKDISIGVD
ncbi:MAG: ATP-binding protein [Nanoarchaeota archaeon]|nr:ATP-binding protein [Nanoarchaeota archaeon]